MIVDLSQIEHTSMVGEDIILKGITSITDDKVRFVAEKNDRITVLYMTVSLFSSSWPTIQMSINNIRSILPQFMIAVVHGSDIISVTNIRSEA